jgi:hypothetical protein
MPHKPQDPLRARLLDQIEEAQGRLAALREYGSTPGNTWLARGELQALSTLLSDLESLLEEIRQNDRESGY